MFHPYFVIAETENKGRCCVAVRPIEANRIIVREPTLATVLYKASRKLYCSYCTNKVNEFGFILLYI
jgi:hypothetical protein